MCYEEKKYYACVNLLITQCMGIIDDNGKYIKEKDINAEVSKEELMKICVESSIDKDNITRNNEKNHILHIIAATQEDPEYLGLIVKYFSKIMKNGSNVQDSDMKKDPYRNLICHGTQLNYGSKEHAVKAFLLVKNIINICELFRQIEDIQR